MTTKSDTKSDSIQKVGISEGFFREINIEYLIHELKDPVAVIETGIRSLLAKQDKYGDLTPRQQKVLKRTLRSTLKARAMLGSLLEVGRSEAGCFHCARFQPLNSIYRVLQDVLDIVNADVAERLQGATDFHDARQLMADNGVVLSIDPQLESIEIIQDETKFRQVMGNLIKNALYYRHQTVEIRLGCDPNHLIVEVIDDGPGIDPVHHQLIFEQFRQVSACTIPARNGHGLGLTGSRIMARCLGGDIELESRKGHGAKFRLRLPLHYPGTSENETGGHV